MKTLVLNSAYQPINVTSLYRAFKLVYLGKAVIIEHDIKNPIKTGESEFKRPTVIKLNRYIYVNIKQTNLNRKNIFIRDNHKCLYCGSSKDLTIDHVIPKSKGGKNTWENLATCCKTCNSKKDDYLLSEIDMQLKYKPFKPTFLHLIKYINDDWYKYIGRV